MASLGTEVPFEDDAKEKANVTLTENKDESFLLTATAEEAQQMADALSEMRGYLDADEAELRELTDSALYKLGQMRDEDFDALDLTPDFDTEGAAYGG